MRVASALVTYAHDVIQLQAPSLIQEIRDAGLVVGFCDNPSTYAEPLEGKNVDVYIRDGIVVYMDHSTGEQFDV